MKSDSLLGYYIACEIEIKPVYCWMRQAAACSLYRICKKLFLSSPDLAKIAQSSKPSIKRDENCLCALQLCYAYTGNCTYR